MIKEQFGPILNSITLLVLVALLCTCSRSNQGNSDPVAANRISAANPSEAPPPRLKFTTGIRSILEDRKGNIWFGSHNEGVARFDGETFTYFTTANGLTHPQVRSMREDVKGTIWFEGGQGLSTYDGLLITPQRERSFDSKHHWQMNPHDLWFKGEEEIDYNPQEGQPGVYRYDGSKLSFHAFPVEPREDDSAHYSVTTPAVKAQDGHLWFATYGAVIGYDGADFTIIDNAYLNLDEETGFLHVRSLFEDSQGNLWIGNNGIGLLKFNGDTIVNVSAAFGLVASDSSHSGDTSPPGTLEHVFAIQEDQSGNLWVGDRDTGAWRFDGESWHNYTEQDGLPDQHIWTIYRTSTGKLWFGLANGSVYQFEGAAFTRVF